MAQPSRLYSSLIRLAALGLGAIACFFLVKAVMIFLNPSSVWKAPRAMSETPIQAQAAAGENNKIDFNFDPFFRDDAAAPLEEIVDLGADAPETTLNLKLKGFISPNRAIIEGVDRKQSSYGVGDEVTDNVTIDSIFPEEEYLILNRGGEKEKLAIERMSVTGNDKEASTVARGNRPAISRSSVIAGKLNPAQLMQSVSFEPVSNNSRTIGYKIAAAPGVDLKALGFRPGDVITKIGTQDVSQPGMDLKSTILESVMGGNTTAQIMRRGRRMTIRVNIK